MDDLFGCTFSFGGVGDQPIVLQLGMYMKFYKS